MWRRPGENMPPPTPLPELKRRMGEVYDAWQRGDEGPQVSLGLIGPEEAARIKAATGMDSLLNRRELVAKDIKHAFDEHGQEKIRGQISILREDFERYAEIITDPHSIEPGTKPNSIRYQRRYPDGTVYVIEQQLKGNKLEFRTLWKQALGGVMVPILIAKTAADEDESGGEHKK